MRVEKSWLDEGRGLHRRYIGDVSICDVLEATMELQEHPKFPALRYLIEDYTQATNKPFGSGDVKGFTDVVRFRGNTKNDLKLAIVSRNTPESIATANGFCEFMKQSHYVCKVFLTLADAKNWAEVES